MRLAALFKRKIVSKNGCKLFKIFIFENYRRFRCVLHTLWLYNSSYMLRIGPLCVRHENATISLKIWFSPKNRDFGRKCHLNQVTLKRHPTTNIGPWSTPKVWKCVWGVSGVHKKCFWAHLMHLDIILSTLNFGRKIKIFRFFGRKTLEKSPLVHLSSAKKGAKIHFKRKKILFSKTTNLLDVFCTLFDSLTPKT